MTIHDHIAAIDAARNLLEAAYDAMTEEAKCNGRLATAHECIEDAILGCKGAEYHLHRKTEEDEENNAR